MTTTPGTFTDSIASHSAPSATIVQLAVDKSGFSNKFASCARDGSIWIWDSSVFENSDNKPEIYEIADRTHGCIAWKGDHIYAGTSTTDILTNIEKQAVGCFQINDFESSTCAFSFSLDVTAIDISENFLVCGASDFTIKKKRLESDAHDKFDLEGQVLCISIDPKEEVFAATTTDGSLSIYPTEGIDRIAIFEKLFPSFGDIDVTNPRAQIGWSKDSSNLFVPSVGGVKILDVKELTVLDTKFEDRDLLTETFSALCVSKCGRYIAAATLAGHICVWNTSDRSLIGKYEHTNNGSRVAVSCLAFDSANEKNLIVADVKEGICVLRQVIARSEHIPTDSTSSVMDDEELLIDKNKRRRMMLDDEAEDDEDSRMSMDLGAIKRTYGFSQENDLDGDIDARADTYGMRNEARVPVPTGPPVVSFEPPVLPSFFVSGGVPERNNEGTRLKKRYLKWNNFGMIRWFKEEDSSRIEVEYHNVSICSEQVISLTDADPKYCMGDLSDQGYVLASKEKEKKPSVVLVAHFGAWDIDSRRWELTLPEGDGAINVLITSEMVVILTEQGNIRLLTLSGTQRHIISHAAPIVTACASGSQLAIASVQGGPFWTKNEDGASVARYQHDVTIYSISPRDWYRGNFTTKTVPLPLGKRNDLQWLGFTNKGQLSSMDNTGTLRILTPSNFWMPVFSGLSELRAISDTIWPISVIEAPNRQLRYIYCRGSRFPLIELKQAPVIAQWEVPLCNSDTDKSKLEGELILNELRHAELEGLQIPGSATELAQLDHAHLATLIKLFAISVRSGRESRASELATLCQNSRGIQSMCNYAAKQKRNMLCEKVSAIGRDLLYVTSSHPSSSNAGAIAPRKVVVRKRDSLLDPLVKQANTSILRDDEDMDKEEPERDTQDTLDTSLPIPLQKTPGNRNPFKRALDTSVLSEADTSSVFDQLDASIDMRGKKNKDLDEKTQSQTPRAKQAKLCFNKENVSTSRTPKGKGGSTPFDLWLAENENRLRKEFNGDEMDFGKFCTQSFRMLPPTEKKEWKARAEGVAN